MPPAATAPETPELILDAAERRYLRHGPRKTTMDEVAREAGCSRATLYAHFASKRDLYAGLLRRETDAFVADLEAIASGEAPAPRKLRRVVEATVRTYAGSPLLFGAVAGDDELALEAIARPVIEAHEARVEALLAELVAAGAREGAFRRVDAAAVAHLMYTLGQALVARSLAAGPGHDLEHLLEAMDDLIGLGLAVRPRAPRKGGTRVARTSSSRAARRRK